MRFTEHKAVIFGAWKAYAIAIAVALLVATITIYVIGAEKAKGQRDLLEAQLATALIAAEANSKAFEDCQKVNAANKQEADAQRIRAIEAEKRTAALKALADRGAKDIEREAETYRAAGLECPAIDSVFRDWLRDNP